MSVVFRKINAINDFESLERFIDESSLLLFGDFDLWEKIENSCLSYCLLFGNEIVAAIILDDNPNLGFLLPGLWLDWFRRLYGLKEINTSNSLWIHWLVYKETQQIDFTDFFKNIFLRNPLYEYILMLKMPHTPKKIWMNELFKRYLPIFNCGVPEFDEIQTLYMMRRKNVLKLDGYHIYKANSDDYENLKQSIARLSESDKQGFDETTYFNKKLQETDYDKNPLIVIECHSDIIGFIALNSKLNFQVLVNEFELGPFQNLSKTMNKFPKLIKDLSLIDIHSFIDTDLIDFDRFSFDDKQLEIIETSLTDLTVKPHTSVNAYSIPDIERILNIFTYELKGAIEFHDFQNIYLVSNDNSSDDDDDSIKPLEPTEIKEPLNNIESNEEHPTEEDQEEVEPEELSESDSSEEDIDSFDSNAFAIETIFLKPEYEKEILLEILKMCFRCFSDRDYCLISVPSKFVSKFLLKFFTKAASKSNSSKKHDLFILHRAILLSTFSVREATEEDEEDILDLIPKCSHFDNVYRDLRIGIDETNCVFVFQCNGVTIGFAIIRIDDDFDIICANYQLYKWTKLNIDKDNTYLKIIHCLIVPQFEYHYKFFVRELMRLMDYPMIFDSSPDREGNETLTSLTNVFINLKPKKFQSLPVEQLKDIEMNELIYKPMPEIFSLRFTTKRLTFLTKRDCNLRFVIIGLNEITLGFLKYLFFSRKLMKFNFTNVTLISEHGLEYMSDNPPAMEFFFKKSHEFNRRMLKHLFLKRHIHLIYSTVQRVNIRHKFVKIKSRKFIHYDYLIVSHNFQDLPPPNIRQRVPENMFIINNENDARGSIRSLKKIYENDVTAFSRQIIVFGNTLEAYCCVRMLQRIGVRNNKITFIKPPVADQLYCFKDILNRPEVYLWIEQSIKDSGINVLEATRIMGWNFKDNSYVMKSVRILHGFKVTTYECLALFYYGNRNVSQKFLMTLRGLTMTRKRLDINRWFLTSNKYIFAVGEFTFCRDHSFARILSHEHLCHVEIGKKLAQSLLTKSNVIKLIDKDVYLTKYKKPLIFDCKLPGDIHFFKVQKPGVIIPYHIYVKLDSFGILLETGSLNKVSEEGFFQLKMDSMGIINAIVCLRKKAFPSENFVNIFGKSEAIFDNMVFRYQNGMIADYFKYFTEPWTCAIYHERFNEKFLHELRRLFNCKVIWKEFYKFKLKTNPQYTHQAMPLYIENKIIELGIQNQIQKEYLKYIFENREVLNMYFHPKLLQNYLLEWEE